MSEDKVLDAMKRKRDQLIPSGPEIMIEATRRVIADNRKNPEYIKSHFSKLVGEIESLAYKIYKEAEKKSTVKIFREVFSKKLPEKPKADDFFQLLDSHYSSINAFFLSLSQSRKARAGKAFEHIIHTLFDNLDYPYSSQKVINGKPDFLLPNESHFRNKAMDCIIFTVKRTLKERWRQIVTEGMRGYLFFLATIDTKISANQLSEIQEHRIYVVVPENIRSETYSNATNVISFETFFDEHLDPAMQRWKKNKVI